MDIYELVRGPFAWVALIVFVAGSLYRIAAMLISGKKEPSLYPATSLKDGLRSILHGLMPFGSTYMRRQPLFTVVTIGFHLGVIILPLFLLAHTVLWYESWDILWWSLPDLLADIVAVWVMLACVYFLVRRSTVPEVKQITRPTDILLPAIVLLTFLTGFLAYHQWGPYRPMLILHILAGEILLVTIPFSKLGHMLFVMFSRAYMGAEFGKVLKAREW
ncbi:MAG: nitrate reductase [Deltaproteobacteria bacterium]|jgi:nitrate reductase gamma subunit|nr:nitrate reductase [Deltaproteobacteria bacterium]